MDTSCNVKRENENQTIEDLKAELHPKSNVKKVIGIVSGKGGVGKSLVTSMLAVSMKNKGYKTAILDADITGPSIPKMFGLKGHVVGNEKEIKPAKSKEGIDIMSINLLLEKDTDPVIWRGPIIGNIVKQFWTDVIWEDIDYMFIDMPPGTGDVPLTAFQSLDIDGIVIVTSPQELVSMIVSKAVTMADKMNIPILGLVENMAYFKCSKCDNEHKIFGESDIKKIAAKYNIQSIARLPIEPKIASACDNGEIETIDPLWLNPIIPSLKLDKSKQTKGDGKMTQKIAIASEKDLVSGHFGHCEGFSIYDIKEGKIDKKEFVPNPGHRPGFLPNFLNEQGVNIIISGGMGQSAINIFNEKGIQVITGATGNVNNVIKEYLEGNLRSTGSVCREHNYAGECEEH
ncbi:iron-sulfur cluster carrier protein MrpORP [Proteinivorax tanatarense]|uniref:iron-sulfur cluster carrier protein MrpORP n=1 Tax=Proteinivorax tanatarense TaxID=1260629 RepID=UPI003D9C72DA